jgi:raffinose/stachyose/melibiose transport system substrate-binding protein
VKTPRIRLATRGAALAFALALGLSACSSSGAPTEENNTFTVWWFDTPDSAMGIASAHALEEFKKAHPDVQVVFEQKSFEQMQQTGTMVLNSDTAPDVMEFTKGSATAGLAAKSGLLVDLTETAAKRGWNDLMPPSVAAVGHYDERGVLGLGPLYGIPNYGEFVSVYYNKDLFDQHGVKVPATMAEFEAAMDAFVAAGVTPLSVAGAEYGANHLWYQLALTKADRPWVNNFQLFEGDVDFHDEAWTFAAQTMLDWQEKGYFSKDATGLKATDMLTEFTTGQNPMMVSGTWFDGQLSAATDLNWSKFSFPGADYISGSGGNIWVVPERSTQKELAEEFINFTLQPDAQMVLANAGAVAVAADPAQVTDPHAQESATMFAGIAESDGLAYYADWPAPGFYDFQVKSLQSLLTGTLSVAQFNDAIAKFYQDYAAQIG